MTGAAERDDGLMRYYGGASRGSVGMAKHLPEYMSPRLIEQVRRSWTGDLAWPYPAILDVVRALAAQGYAILGGDVMYDVGGGLLDHFRDGVYGGNWYIDWKGEGTSWAGYVAESLAVTERYIEAYVRRNVESSSYWFVPDWADEAAYAQLSQQRRQ
jgi:hypothetical protein